MFKKILITTLSLIILTSCTNKPSTTKNILNGQEHIAEITAGIINNFAPEIIETLKTETGKEIEPLYVIRYKPNTDNTSTPIEIPINGISIRSLPKEKALNIYHKYYDEFREKGYTIFITNYHKGHNSEYDLAVSKTTDQFKVVKQINTESVNYDITNQTVINKLKTWERSIPFRLVIIDNDTITAEILKMPKTPEAFVLELFDFCPDLAAGSLVEYAKALKETKTFWLWWD